MWKKHSHADKGMREFLSGDFFMGEAFRLWFSLCKNEGKLTKVTGLKNAKKSFVTKLQEWDYTLGIFGVKLYQGNYNSTLVAQGAFSAYKTNLLKE